MSDDEETKAELGRMEEVVARVEALTKWNPPAVVATPDRSEQLNELAAALAKAQGAMELASKDSTNPHFQSKFASLASCIAAIKKPLADNGLCWIQRPGNKTASVSVETVLIHSSGQWISSVLNMPVDKGTPQGFGSALTYCRRYALCAMLGIAAEDDDAELASKPIGPQAKGGTYVKPQGKPDSRLTPEQNKQMENLFRPGA